MLEPLDVVVATVGHSDVPSLNWPGEDPLEPSLFGHPIYGDIPRLRQYGRRALKRLEQDAFERRADAVRLPLLDPVLAYVAEAGGAPPAVLLVATDQEDPDFREGDTVDLARFMQAVLDYRSERRARTVDVLGVGADPSDFVAVFQALTGGGGLGERVRSYRPAPPVRVGLATTGGPPVLTVVVALVLAAAAGNPTAHTSARQMEVSELRLDRSETIRRRSLVAVANALGLGACSGGAHASAGTSG